jgi:hypothetical protein
VVKLIQPYTRDLDFLHPDMLGVLPRFRNEIEKAKISMIITCTARLMKCQVALYAQGRQSIEEINRLRKFAGMAPIDLKEAKKKVTWTLTSKHLVDFDNDIETDNYSHAFDFAIINGKNIDYNIKADINKNKIPEYEEVGIIAEKCGLVWGGRWKTPDYPHIQMKG